MSNGYSPAQSEGGGVVTLYRKHSSGGLGSWKIWAENNAIMYAHAVVLGGAEQLHQEFVVMNKSGRDLESQIQLQLNARISRMLDKGYKRTQHEALSGPTNQLGLHNPMLAHPINKVRVAPWEWAHLQPKFDGHRCLTTKQGGIVTAYTRKGKILTAISHITDQLHAWLPEGVTIDGELYKHGWSLQKISSAAKTREPNVLSEHLIYCAYDLIEDEPFSYRFNSLSQMVPDNGPVVLTPTQRITSMEEAYRHFKLHRSLGYEGSMLRLDLRGYEDGRRSDQLLKLKERHDAEFKVTGFKEGKNKVAILVLELDGNRTFDCLAPGTVQEKQKVLEDSDAYLNRSVTVEYACLTEDGVPFHCVATRWREDL